jgi:hypothetical protein
MYKRLPLILGVLRIRTCRAVAALVEEKNTRAKLRSEVDRHLSKSTTVVLDSLNFVKGYRYELWCLARAAGTKCCVVWVDSPVEACRGWNSARSADQVGHKILEFDMLSISRCACLWAVMCSFRRRPPARCWSWPVKHVVTGRTCHEPSRCKCLQSETT